MISQPLPSLLSFPLNSGTNERYGAEAPVRAALLRAGKLRREGAGARLRRRRGLRGLESMTTVNYITSNFQKQFMNCKLYLKLLLNALNGN